MISFLHGRLTQAEGKTGNRMCEERTNSYG